VPPYQREPYENWIREYLQRRHPDLVGPFRAALNAFETAIGSGVLTTKQLLELADVVRSPNRPLSENAAVLLGELAAKFPQARHLIEAASQDAKLHVRVNALVALSAMDPGELHDAVLRTALNDRSSKLRLLAANKIAGLGLKNLLPDLAQAILRERDPDARRSLERERDLLRDGFHASSQEDGRVWVTCRLPDGSLRSRFFSSADVESKGLEAIARSLAAEA
jgi:HEAT repeat protein